MTEEIEKESYDLENEFKIWMKDQINTRTNLPYKVYTIEGYSKALREASKEIKDLKSVYKINLFSIDNLTKFIQIEEKIRASDDFERVNKKHSKGRVSAGMNKYSEFLDLRSTKNNVDPDIEKYDKQDFLSDVFIDEKDYETIKTLLNRKKNIILQGPPGVGKTFVAKRLAYSIMGNKNTKRVEMIQFHQSYSYEDFIMGYRPTEGGFELKEGPFYKFCKQASENDEDHYFIIDEINRGNMSKIFGELMMLIESDKRGEELMLTYSDIPFKVPENVYIIGMMNTADRSLAIIDYALRRRFSFFELEPAFETKAFENHLINQGVNEGLINKIKLKLKKINNEISIDVNLGKDYRVGHSYFCDYQDAEDNWYENIIKYEIRPLLEEYWFDEDEIANKHIEELLK